MRTVALVLVLATQEQSLDVFLKICVFGSAWFVALRSAYAAPRLSMLALGLGIRGLIGAGVGLAVVSLLGFWLPALLPDELPSADCPPVRLRLLGEDLVAFRDSNNKIGVVEAHCPHRGASLYFGRNEECGIRCVYHGWKFDVDGNCVDMPSEPAESNFKDKIHLTAYPTAVHGGLIWVYMGPQHLRAELPQHGADHRRRGVARMAFDRCSAPPGPVNVRAGGLR